MNTVTPEQIDSDFHDATELLIYLSRHMPPDAFKASLAGLIANVVGNLPDDYWQEFVKVKPCGRPGCKCHEAVAKHGTELFKLLRKDHAEHTEIGSLSA